MKLSEALEQGKAGRRYVPGEGAPAEAPPGADVITTPDRPAAPSTAPPPAATEQPPAEDDYAARLRVEEFPPYSPELNPSEQLWNWAKDKQLANFVPDDLTQLLLAVEHMVSAAARDQRRLRSFFEASELPW